MTECESFKVGDSTPNFERDLLENGVKERCYVSTEDENHVYRVFDLMCSRATILPRQLSVVVESYRYSAAEKKRFKRETLKVVNCLEDRRATQREIKRFELAHQEYRTRLAERAFPDVIRIDAPSKRIKK